MPTLHKDGYSIDTYYSIHRKVSLNGWTVSMSDIEDEKEAEIRASTFPKGTYRIVKIFVLRQIVNEVQVDKEFQL